MNVSMINFGLKELIEKLEEYFGKTATKAFLAIVGVCVLFFVIGLAVNASIYPLALWFGSLGAIADPNVSAARESISWLVTIIWIVFVLFLGVLLIQARHELRGLADARDVVVEQRQQLKEIDELYQQAKELQQKAITLMPALAEKLRLEQVSEAEDQSMSGTSP